MIKELKHSWEKKSKSMKKSKKEVKNHHDWDYIERLNEGLGITRKICYVDQNGYLRWKSNKRLCHRDIAYKYIYKKHKFKLKFSEYEVHHEDENKLNNNPKNLKILTPEQHDLEHANKISLDGKNYIDVGPLKKKRKHSKKEVQIGGKYGEWYKKKYFIIRNGQLYMPEWMLKKNYRI